MHFSPSVALFQRRRGAIKPLREKIGSTSFLFIKASIDDEDDAIIIKDLGIRY